MYKNWKGKDKTIFADDSTLIEWYGMYKIIIVGTLL